MTKRTLAALAVAALIAVGCSASPDDSTPVDPNPTATAPLGVKGNPPTPKVTKSKAAKPKPKKAAKPKPAAKYYSNCAAMRRDFPNGVASGHGSYSRRLDRDRDGRACER